MDKYDLSQDSFIGFSIILLIEIEENSFYGKFFGIKMKNVLIVEDETIFALDLKRILSKSGFNVLRVFTEGKRAIEFALEEKPDVILMDISLKGELNGVDTARKIYKYYKPLIIFISALDKLAFDFSGLEYKFMSKPILDKNLISILNYS